MGYFKDLELSKSSAVPFHFYGCGCAECKMDADLATGRKRQPAEVTTTPPRFQVSRPHNGIQFRDVAVGEQFTLQRSGWYLPRTFTRVAYTDGHNAVPVNECDFPIHVNSKELVWRAS